MIQARFKQKRRKTSQIHGREIHKKSLSHTQMHTHIPHTSNTHKHSHTHTHRHTHTIFCLTIYNSHTHRRTHTHTLSPCRGYLQLLQTAADSWIMVCFILVIDGGSDPGELPVAPA